MSPAIVTNRAGRVEIVTLNKPEKLNAWDKPMREQLMVEMDKANRDPEVGALVLTGAGSRAFCAGQDLTEARSFTGERGESWIAEWQRLYERREHYPMGVVPEGGLFLTAGVDVQKDRLECEIVAWGRNKESWSVDYHTLEGDTARQEVWEKLEGLLRKDWPHACGATLPIRVMAVDSGYATQDVYAWAKGHPQASWGGSGSARRRAATPSS